MVTPMPFARQRVCGHEYHEATEFGEAEMQYCACDTGAIGRCANDHRPVCGYHSKLRDGRRLCDECAARFDQDVANAKMDAALGEVRARVARIRAACEELARVPDPADQVLLLLLLAQSFKIFHGCTQEASARALPELHQTLRAAASALRGPATSELLDASSQQPTLWTCKPAMIGHWLRTGRLRGAGLTKLRLVSYEKGLFGGLKRVPRGHVKGWRIQTAIAGSSGPYGSSGKPSEYVLTDGTVGVGDALSADSKREDIRISHVLILMDKGHLTPPVFPASVTACLAELADVKIPAATA